MTPQAFRYSALTHDPVLLTLTGAAWNGQARNMLPQKGRATFGTMWAASKSCLQSCGLDSRLPLPVTVPQLPTGRFLPRCLLSNAVALETFQQSRRPCQVQMLLWADAEYGQVRQRLAHARRHPMQASASELTRLQHQMQGMRKHKKRNHVKANRTKLEAACRAGRPSFWTPFKVRKLSECPVNAQAQLAYMAWCRHLLLSSCSL